MKLRLSLLVTPALIAAVAPAAATAEIVPTGYNPMGLPTVGCFWTGPFTSQNPVTNVAYPGKQITYWSSRFRLPEGSMLEIHGEFSHARYQSWNAYINGAPTNSVPDSETESDPGSTNPFVVGADRRAKKRSYTLTVLDAPLPATPAPNTLYAQPDDNGYSEIVFRVYLPDKDRTRRGGAPMPVPEVHLADGTVLRDQALCDDTNVNSAFPSPKVPLATYQALVNTPGKDPQINPALDPPFVERFFSVPYALSFYSSPDSMGSGDATVVGGLYSNNDVAYLASFVNLDFGRVIVIHAKKTPTTPATYGGEPTMGNGQLRYWDWCYDESLVTTETHDCVTDAQVPHERGGPYTVVVSKRDERPDNAYKKCGVAWLAFGGEGDGVGNPDKGTLSYRSLLPSPSFHRATQDVTEPQTAASVMGPFFPRLSYTSVADYEAKGC